VIQNRLIEVEGAKTPPKMLTHFHRAWAGSRELTQCPAGLASQCETPQACNAEEARRLPAESEAPGTKISNLILQTRNPLQNCPLSRIMQGKGADK